MSEAHRSRNVMRALRTGILPLSCAVLFAGTAHAQSFSPGGLVAAPLPQNRVLSRGATGGETLPGNPPPVSIDIFAALSGEYSSNATGTPVANDDFSTRAEVTVNASAETARFNGALNYNGMLDYYVDGASDVIISNRLTGRALFDVIPDHFILSTSVFAAPVYTSRLGNIAPSGSTLPPGSNSDLRNTYGFSVQPDFSFRLGNFLRSDFIPSYSAVYVDQYAGAGAPPLANVADQIITKALTERITSGNYFNRLQWSGIASYSEMGKSSGGLTQRSATGELAYAVTHNLTLLADGGYQNVKARVPLNKALSGPIYFGGLKFDFARLTGEVRAGQQYRSFSVNGHLRFEITPVISLIADVQDDVTTPGANLASPSAFLDAVLQGVASGQIQIPASGILNLNEIPLGSIGLQNNISRIKSYNFGLHYGLDRLTAQLTASVTEQDALSAVLPGQNANLQTIGISPSVSYAFSPSFTGRFTASFSDETLTAGKAKVAEFRLGGNYAVGEKTQLFMEGGYLHRDSDSTLTGVSPVSGDVSVTTLRMGLRHHF